LLSRWRMQTLDRIVKADYAWKIFQRRPSLTYWQYLASNIALGGKWIHCHQTFSLKAKESLNQETFLTFLRLALFWILHLSSQWLKCCKIASLIPSSRTMKELDFDCTPLGGVVTLSPLLHSRLHNNNYLYLSSIKRQLKYCEFARLILSWRTSKEVKFVCSPSGRQ
jgi:hypothetical protein